MALVFLETVSKLHIVLTTFNTAFFRNGFRNRLLFKKTIPYKKSNQNRVQNND
jgi:hypothetical protein